MFTRLLLASWALLTPAIAAAAVKVVTTTQDLAAITKAIGGGAVEVSFIARGDLDPHFIDAKPSHMLKLATADLLVAVGMELEVGWLPAVIQGSRNPRIAPGGQGYLDASVGITPIEVPTGPIDRSRGDLHAAGNPHYWLDPENGRVIARAIATRLEALDPAHLATYQQGLTTFEAELTRREAGWATAMAPLRGAPVVGYHSTFDYFLTRYGLRLVGFVEPKPGIPPTPSHTLELAGLAKAAGAKLVVVEPYHPISGTVPLTQATGARAVVLPTSVGSAPTLLTYFDLFDALVAALTHP